MIKAKKLFVFSFFDLNGINDSGIYESNFRDIYPEELELRREIGNNVNANFSGLDIKIKTKNVSNEPFLIKETVFFLASLKCLKNLLTYSQIYSTCQLELTV